MLAERTSLSIFNSVYRFLVLFYIPIQHPPECGRKQERGIGEETCTAAHPATQTRYGMQESPSIVPRYLAYGHHGPFDGCQPLRSEGGGHTIPKRIAGSSPVLGKDERPFFPSRYCGDFKRFYLMKATLFHGDIDTVPGSSIVSKNPHNLDARAPPRRIFIRGNATFSRTGIQGNAHHKCFSRKRESRP